jgi:hypothetical protein
MGNAGQRKSKSNSIKRICHKEEPALSCFLFSTLLERLLLESMLQDHVFIFYLGLYVYFSTNYTRDGALHLAPFFF